MVSGRGDLYHCHEDVENWPVTAVHSTATST